MGNDLVRWAYSKKQYPSRLGDDVRRLVAAMQKKGQGVPLCVVAGTSQLWNYPSHGWTSQACERYDIGAETLREQFRMAGSIVFSGVGELAGLETADSVGHVWAGCEPMIVKAMDTWLEGSVHPSIDASQGPSVPEDPCVPPQTASQCSWFPEDPWMQPARECRPRMSENVWMSSIPAWVPPHEVPEDPWMSSPPLEVPVVAELDSQTSPDEVPGATGIADFVLDIWRKPDHEILGIPTNPSMAEFGKAYRAKLLKHDPDKESDNEKKQFSEEMTKRISAAKVNMMSAAKVNMMSLLENNTSGVGVVASIKGRPLF